VCRRVDQAGASYLTEAASNSVTHAAHDMDEQSTVVESRGRWRRRLQAKTANAVDQ
jgi:hypothetical protein